MEAKKQNLELVDIVAVLSLIASYLCLAGLRIHRTADVVIDFGREVYIPWQISQGAVLQRDIFSIYGPLSHYFNALMFHLGGASLQTLYKTNIFIGIFFISALYVVARRFSKTLTAFYGVLFIIVVFSFGHYTQIANYNWLTPYSHEAIHGVFLSVCCLLLVLRSDPAARSSLSWIIIGTLLGAVFLTKAEIFTALGLSIAVYFFLINRGYRLHHLLALIFGLLILPLAFLFYFSSQMPLPAATKAVLGMWNVILFGQEVISNPAYLEFMGFDDVGRRLTLVLAVSGLVSIAAFPFFIIDKLLNRSRGLHPAIAGLLFIVFSALLFRYSDLLALNSVPRAFPVISVLVAGLLFLVNWVKKLRGNALSSEQIALTVFGVFSAVMTGRMLLNAHFGHFAFFLLPCCCLFLFAVSTEKLQSTLSNAIKGPSLLSCLFYSFFAVMAILHLQAASQNYSERNFAIDGVGGEFILDFDAHRFKGRSLVVARAVEYLKSQLKDGERFLVLPEGSLLNFLLKVPNSTNHVSYATEVFILGHDKMLNSVRKGRPEYVLLLTEDLAHQNIPHYKVKGYGLEILNWVEENYSVVWRDGPEPLSNEGYGAKLYKLNSAS